jgi:transposase
MKLYCGIDLHSNNSYVVLLDETGKVVYKKRLPNDLEGIKAELMPYQAMIVGIVVESTYNWYWLVDGLRNAGYRIHLANPNRIQQYNGLKHTDDKTDAIWLAELLRLNILTEGYIYPKEQRGLRELLRRRMKLVKQQTMNVLGIQGMVTRYENIRLTARIVKCKPDEEEQLLQYVKDEDVKLAVKCQIKILRCILEEVTNLEKAILAKVEDSPAFIKLRGIPGIGPILSMLILLETGEISRFKNPGNYSSYCRCVKSERISNEKKKGENNRKNGNHYLSWAYVEAANYAIRFDKTIKNYYQRKMSKTNRIVAIKTVANKLTKACFFILRDGVEFDMKKIFV